MLCVYAVVPAGRDRLGLRGMRGERLRLIVAGAVAAVVGGMTRRPEPTEANLREYDRTVRALMERFGAVAPARFGTLVATPEEVVLILRTRQVFLRRMLSRLRNRAQMTVRIAQGAGGHEERRRGVPGDGGQGAGLSQEAVSGGEYLRARAAAQRVPGLESIRSAIDRWIRDERVERRGAVASVYHLVPRRAGSAYRAAVEREARRSGVRLIVSGPWPPYAFATW